jgi:hypothetical protein
LDGAVLDVVQLVEGEVSGSEGRSGLFHFGWAQQAPDMVGAIGLRHG